MVPLLPNLGPQAQGNNDSTYVQRDYVTLSDTWIHSSSWTLTIANNVGGHVEEARRLGRDGR